MHSTTCPAGAPDETEADRYRRLSRAVSIHSPDLEPPADAAHAAMLEAALWLPAHHAGLPPVSKPAELARFSQNQQELYAAGCLALRKAADNFDPGRGVKFTTYAYRAVKKAVAREEMRLRGNGLSVNVQETVSGALFHLHREGESTDVVAGVARALEEGRLTPATAVAFLEARQDPTRLGAAIDEGWGEAEAAETLDGYTPDPAGWRRDPADTAASAVDAGVSAAAVHHDLFPTRKEDMPKPERRKHSTKRLYPWPLWSNGELHTITRGVDFDLPAANMRQNLQTTASRKGFHLRSMVVGDTITFAFLPKAEQVAA